MNKTKVIRIGDVEAKPGQKKTGSIKVGETPLSDITIPVGIINGIKGGPTLCVIAGEHAMEYPGINAAISIFKNTDPNKISGSLIVVPVVNTPAFNMRTPYVNPIDNVNVASAGSLSYRDGTISHIIKRSLVEKVISSADYLLNLHGGDYPEFLYPFTIVGLTGDENIDVVSAKIGKIFGTKYIIQRKSIRTSIRASEDEVPKIMITHIVGEAGSLGWIDEDSINVHLTGVTNVMKFLKMVEGDPIIQTDQKVIEKMMRVRAGYGGLFYPKAKPGDIVSKGAILSEIRDVWGETKEKQIAPEDGIITYMFLRHVVNTGDPLFSLGLIENTNL